MPDADAAPDPEDLVLYEKGDPGVAWITLNRPRQLNAINMAMRDALWSYLEAASLDPDVRVLCFRGASGRAFSAGADISEFGTAPSYIEARRAREQRDLWARLEDLPLITIAALHGYCFGAGIELALFCDLRIAAEDSRIALPEVSLGYMPSAGGTQTLPRIAPADVALGLVVSGDELDAAAALRWGVVHEVVPVDELEATVTARARRLAGLDVETMLLAKRAIRRGLDLSLDAAIAQDAVSALGHRIGGTG